jgi:hypothetical protein
MSATFLGKEGPARQSASPPSAHFTPGPGLALPAGTPPPGVFIQEGKPRMPKAASSILNPSPLSEGQLSIGRFSAPRGDCRPRAGMGGGRRTDADNGAARPGASLPVKWMHRRMAWHRTRNRVACDPGSPVADGCASPVTAKRTAGCFGDLAGWLACPGSVVPDYGADRFRFDLLFSTGRVTFAGCCDMNRVRGFMSWHSPLCPP